MKLLSGDSGHRPPPRAPGAGRAAAALFFLAWLAGAAIDVRAGRVQTLDGHAFTGEVGMTNGALVVTFTNTILGTIPLTNLLTADFVDPDDPGPGAAGEPGLGLLGYYFPNTNGTGTAFVRLDETVDFDWAAVEPAPGLPRDSFSVIWTGEVEAPASGDFTFSVLADDCARLYLTNQLLLEACGPRPASELTSSPIPMEGGRRYPIRLVYANLSGAARIALRWTGPDVPRHTIPKPLLHPGAFPPNRVGPLRAAHGLLASYYPSPEFVGPAWTRIDPTVLFDWPDQDPAPGIGRTNFSVRWSGQIQIDQTEEYTFYTLTDERVRVWLDNKLLIDRPELTWTTESKESVPLVAGERYDLRMETVSTSGGAVARLLWSSASIAKTNVPSSHLFPSKPAPRSNPWPGPSDKTPPGIVLRNGSFVAGRVEQASETSLRVAGRLKDRPLSTVNVARIICQPLAPALAKRVTPGRPGVLLAKGDFVDGEFRSLENGRVSLSSIVFGVRTFDAQTEVLVVALRDVSPSRSPFVIRLRDQSALRSNPLGLEPAMLKLEDSALGILRLPAADLLEIRRRPAGEP